MAAQMVLYGGLAALQLAGSYFASQNIKETAKLNQDIADMNAQFAELDAYDALVEGETEQARYQSVIEETLGQQQLIQTAQDIDVNYGTASAVQSETKFIAEMNLMEIEKQAQEKALGFKTQARQFRQSGVIQRAEANAKAASVLFSGAMGAAEKGLTGYKAAGKPDFTTKES
jgi:hypothetical protein